MIWTCVRLTWYILIYFQPGLDRLYLLRVISSWTSDPRIALVGTVCAIDFVSHTIPPLCFGILYYLEHPAIERYRIDKQEIRWNDIDPKRAVEYRTFVKKMIRFHIQKRIETIIIFVSFAFLCHYFQFGDPEYLLHTVPDAFTIVFQLLAGLLMFETMFYWGHRLQHLRYYRYHKIHHEAQQPFAGSAVWGHALDGILTSILPGLLPACVLQMHYFTLLIWIFVHSVQSYYDHSGYEFPWCPFQTIPFSGYTRQHWFHHSHNSGNYGLYWDFWDRWMGTDRAYRIFTKTP
jgi:sterol desaturase/sphingolipid hydroxylase (fatty acid hydroxylase superfamily)